MSAVIRKIVTVVEETHIEMGKAIAPPTRRAAAIAARPAPRGMAIDDLTATMVLAGLPTARQVWTGQPEHLAEMLDEVADFVTRMSAEN